MLVRVWFGFRFDASLPPHQTATPVLFRVLGRVVSDAEDRGERFMAHKLFIGGLSFSTSTDALRTLFAQAGEVESAAVVTDRDTGRSRGFGFVEMATTEGAEEAIRQFDGKQVDGRPLKVERAKGPGAGNGGRTGGGFQRRSTRW
jgi:cold-inducible RNA-binding protein